MRAGDGALNGPLHAALTTDAGVPKGCTTGFARPTGDPELEPRREALACGARGTRTNPVLARLQLTPTVALRSTRSAAGLDGMIRCMGTMSAGVRSDEHGARTSSLSQCARSESGAAYRLSSVATVVRRRTGATARASQRQSRRVRFTACTRCSRASSSFEASRRLATPSAGSPGSPFRLAHAELQRLRRDHRRRGANDDATRRDCVGR